MPHQSRLSSQYTYLLEPQNRVLKSPRRVRHQNWRRGNHRVPSPVKEKPSMHGVHISREPETQASNTQRSNLEFLRLEIHKEKRTVEHPTESLADCHTSIEILKEENEDRANILISDIYWDAFNISIAQSDQARASFFMERAYSERVLCEREDGPDIQNMTKLIKKPSQYGSFALTNKWQTGKKKLPKGLNTE
ncbi:putative set domain-containing protein 5 protein [Botrytis fragariae]|uniref:Putative set domain-containing protein 5 protein n=1 Tax=Botrytis fragariae TaxID=1964551 RepID=A0A8H6AM72_9HELO|nr:putative set domain-containing protein 5 protein [Botrytis fragariae]KAF5870142.1 putative set domain-containing protein 5 protein [Botrytis fragariae]